MNLFSETGDSTWLNFNAAGFTLAYRELMLTQKNHNDLYDTDISIFMFPAIVNLAFAIELTLKRYLEKQSENTKGHKLNELFMKLKLETQNEIILNTIKMSELKCRLLGCKDVLTKETFYILLNGNANAFIEWRYYHEGNKINSRDIDFLEELMFALTMSIEDYEWYLSRIIDMRTTEEKKNDRLKKIFEIELMNEIENCEDRKFDEEIVEIVNKTKRKIAHLIDAPLSEMNEYFVRLINK